jgi:hypothetical protein
MAVLATFATVTGSLKTATDTVKALINARDAAIVQAKANELREQLSSALADAISAYESQMTQLERIKELEEQLAGFEKWEAEKEKYERRKVGAGNIVFALKEESGLPEPSHSLCANCFEDGKKSYLQAETRIPGMARVLACHRCNSDIYINGSWHPDHRRAPARR